MVRFRGSTRFPLRLTVLASLLWGLPGLHAGAEPVDAARVDYVPRQSLGSERLATLPPWCDGAYVEPPLPAASGGANGGDPPVEVLADEASYLRDQRLDLMGNVRLRQGQVTVHGENATYLPPTGDAEIDGPVRIRGRGFLMAGEEGSYNTQSGTMVLNTANFLFHDESFRGTARVLQRTEDEQGRQFVDATTATLTSCHPGVKDWSLAASDVHLDKAAGEGEAWNVRFRVQDVPVFYLPWMSFPIDDRRKSGFLFPSFGTSNTGRGLQLATPYYFNLAPNYDMTYTPEYIHGRGLKSELEGRYLSTLGQTELRLGHIQDDEEFVRDNPGEDGLRWGVDFETRADFGGGWTGLVDYAVVSDDDYLEDLNRTLEIDNATHIERLGQLSFSRPGLQFEGNLQGFQTVDEDISRASRPFFRLPHLMLATNRELGPFELETDNEYTFFWRNSSKLTGNDRVTGHRLRTRPEISYDLEPVWGFLRQSVMVDYTRYELSNFDLNNTSINRTVPFYEADAGLFFDRNLSLFGRPFLQTLEPRLFYVYSPEEDQSDLPEFDTTVTSFNFTELFARDRFSGGDRVGDNNRLTLALTSRFQDMETGQERARFSIGQIYHYSDRQVQLPGDPEQTRSESPVAGEMLLKPIDWVDLRVQGSWDPRDGGRTEQGETRLTVHSPDYRYLLNVGHTYDDDELEQFDINGALPLGDHLSLVGRWVTDLVDDRTIGTLAGIEYNNCCWKFQLVNQGYLTDDEELEHQLLFQIEFKGLGGAGGAMDIISEAIPNFDRRLEPYDF